MSVMEWGARTARRRFNPQHLAWAVLLSGFALFCLLFVTVLLSANHFLFLSSLPMDAVLSVGRGTVGISDLANPLEQVGITGSEIADGVIVRTDPQSQGTIQFLDDAGSERRLLVALTLQRDSRVTLLSAERPRFSWSRSSYEITLQDVIGVINLTVTEHAGPWLRILGRTPGGARLELLGPGSYTLQGAAPELRLFNHDGNALLESPDGQVVRVVPAGRQGAVLYEESRVELRPGYINMLADPQFTLLNTGSDPAEGGAWACGHKLNDLHPGTHDFVSVDGLSPIRFRRDQGVKSHGLNICSQNFGPSGLNLRQLNLERLFLRATFSLKHASLASCGIEGSECPLMFRMDYIYVDEDDNERKGEVWYHGFFIRQREEWPLRCDTCLQNHELIHDNSWYVYESPDLLTLFAPEPPPETIVSISFYASGHEYDVLVHNVALLAQPVFMLDV